MNEFNFGCPYLTYLTFSTFPTQPNQLYLTYPTGGQAYLRASHPLIDSIRNMGFGLPLLEPLSGP